MSTGIQISAAGLTAEQIYDESEAQFEMLNALEILLNKVAEWFTDATDSTEKARLWDQYSGLCRDFTVLSVWYNVTYSAYVFAINGGELRHVTVGGLQLANEFLDETPS